MLISVEPRLAPAVAVQRRGRFRLGVEALGAARAGTCLAWASGASWNPASHRRVRFASKDAGVATFAGEVADRVVESRGPP